jgi:hypothetical protein
LVGEDVTEGFGAAVAGSLDGDLVTSSKREVAPVLATHALHVLDEAMEVQLFGLLLETLEIDDRPVGPVIGLDDPLGYGRFWDSIAGSSIRFHEGKTKGNRCDA